MSEKTMIKVENLTKHLASKVIFEDLSLKIKEKETMVIMGRSGEGKSVLLKHLVRLMKPDRGQIVIEGQNIASLDRHQLPEFRKKIGMLFQGAALFDSLTIEENVGFALLEHTKMSRSEVRDRVKQELGRVQLGENVLDKKPAELSGGMKKRVGLARAIITRPKIILYDEPTTGLDPITSDAINDLILQMQAELGITSVVVTHDMQSAFKVGDRMALLYGNKIAAVGTIEEFKDSDNPLVSQFIKGQAHGPMTDGNLQ